MTKSSRRICFLLSIFPVCCVAADKLSIAAAANLVYALESLNKAFSKREPHTAVTVVTGASGSLVVQIKNGAPFDVFLSADLEYPAQLIKSGAADPATLTTFAVGRLVLWTTHPDLEFASVASVIRDPAVKKIAIANLHTAPYGKAAREALMKLDLWTSAEGKLVFGENITQTAQFVETRNADIGFVAVSLILSPKLNAKGRWHEIPPDLYSPLEQGAVVTTHGASNPAAKRYLAFLRSAEAQAVLERYGYRRP